MIIKKAFIGKDICILVMFFLLAVCYIGTCYAGIEKFLKPAEEGNFIISIRFNDSDSSGDSSDSDTHPGLYTLTERDAIKIAEYLDRNLLEDLTLRDVACDYKTFRVIFEAVLRSLQMRNSHLAVLSLEGIGVDSSLYEWDFEIDDEEISALIDALHKNTTLTMLSLSKQTVYNEKFGVLCAALANNLTLTHVYFGDYEDDDEVMNSRHKVELDPGEDMDDWEAVEGDYQNMIRIIYLSIERRNRLIENIFEFLPTEIIDTLGLGFHPRVGADSPLHLLDALCRRRITSFVMDSPFYGVDRFHLLHRIMNGTIDLDDNITKKNRKIIDKIRALQKEIVELLEAEDLQLPATPVDDLTQHVAPITLEDSDGTSTLVSANSRTVIVDEAFAKLERLNLSQISESWLGYRGRKERCPKIVQDVGDAVKKIKDLTLSSEQDEQIGDIERQINNVTKHLRDLTLSPHHLSKGRSKVMEELLRQASEGADSVQKITETIMAREARKEKQSKSTFAEPGESEAMARSPR